MRGFHITYETITDESAEHGDAADRGFEYEDITFREAVQAIHGAFVEASSYPFDAHYPYTWFTTVDPEIDYATGEHKYYSLHMPADLTPSTRRRIARLLGIRGV